MLGRLTDFASSRRGKWVVVAIWLIVAGALISQLPRLDEANENEQALFLPREAEATRAFRFAQERFPAKGTPVLIVFSQPEGLGAPAYEAAADLAGWLSGPEAPDNVGQVLGPDPVTGQRFGLVSPDSTVMYVFAEVGGPPVEAAFLDTVEAIRDRSASYGISGVEVAAGGPGGLIIDLIGVFATIDTLLLLVTVVLVLVLLIIIYRSPIMATIPLLGVGLVFQMAGAIAAWYAIRYGIPVSGQTTGIMTVVLFGTGTDYVLFVSARFREELTRHEDRHEAMRRTMRGVGGAVASAGMTILVACAALWLATLRSYQALGPVIALAVALMMLAAVTLIPAVLTIFGRRAFWPMQPSGWRLTSRSGPTGGAACTGRVGAVVLRRPGVTLAVTALASPCWWRAWPRTAPTTTSSRACRRMRSRSAASSCCGAAFRAASSRPPSSTSPCPPGESVPRSESAMEKLDALTLRLATHPAVSDASGPEQAVRHAQGPDVSSAAAGESGCASCPPTGERPASRSCWRRDPFSEEALDALPGLRSLARNHARRRWVWVPGAC